MQRSWEQSVVLVTGTAAVLWVAGIVLFLGSGGMEVEHLGLTLIITAAVTTLLGVLRSWQLRMHRAFVHGYHAGFHDATKREHPSQLKDCDVLDFSEVKAGGSPAWASRPLRASPGAVREVRPCAGR